MDTIFSAISALAAAFAAYFSWCAIKENKKNIFLIEKNRVALSVRQVQLDFENQWLEYKISDHLEDQGILLSSKYFIEPSLYDKFTSVLVGLHSLEKKQLVGAAANDMAEKLTKQLRDICCDIRLDH